MDMEFRPKKLMPPQVCRLTVLAADKAEDCGPQNSPKLKGGGGQHDGHTFMDYANRDEDTGQVKQGSKAWSIFEACLGQDFHKKSGVSLESLIGKQFMGQVTQTKTGSRNKVEFGTTGPVPPEEDGSPEKPTDDETFGDLPF